MRILLISNWFPPIISGSSYYTKSLAQALEARGHDVVVVTLDWGTSAALEEELPFPIYRLPVVRSPKLPVFYNLERMGFAFTPGNGRRLKELVEKHRSQLLHCVNHIFDTSFLAVHVARTTKIPVVGSITTPVQHQNPWVQRLYHLGDRLLLGRWGVSQWDGIVSLDQTVHEYVGRVYGREAQERSVVIPFGVRLELQSDYQNASLERAKRPQILMVGHIHPFRNPSQLIRAMPHILAAVPDTRLVLAGRVDLQEPVRTARELGLSDKQVTFLGETPHSKAVELMKSSHVFATWVTGPYPSLGTAPLEAMLCGTPVVSDLPENLFGEGLLKEGENIVLVDSENPKSIAQDIVGLLRDEARRQKIGASGRRFVLKHLSWSRIAETMEGFYETILKRKGELCYTTCDPIVLS